MEKIFNIAKDMGYSGEDNPCLIEDWLRTSKNIHAELFFSMFHKKWSINNYFIDLKKLKKIDRNAKSIMYETYGEAQEVSIREMLETLK